MDIGTGLAILGSKDVVLNVLGPSADYVGALLQGYTKTAHENVRHVFDIALRKLGGRVEQEGEVAPRVLSRVLDEALLCEDELMAEYLGGVLASSRSGVSRDDRGASLVAVLHRLSVYDVRTHHILYAFARRQILGRELDIGDANERQAGARVLVPLRAYMTAMEFDEHEKPELILDISMFTLMREGLVDDAYYAWGKKEEIVRYATMETPPEEGAIHFVPTPLGINLYYAALGRLDVQPQQFLAPTLAPEEKPLVDIPGLDPKAGT